MIWYLPGIKTCSLLKSFYIFMGRWVFMFHSVFEMAYYYYILNGLIEICTIPISMEICRTPNSTVPGYRKNLYLAMGD